MDMQQPPATIDAIREQISAVIADMLYLSESEASLELLPTDDTLHAQAQVQTLIGPVSETADADTFLASIRSSIDPDDDGLKAYLAQWESLFTLLRSHSTDICIYRSGADPVTITIAAIIGNDAVLIRTTAVET